MRLNAAKASRRIKARRAAHLMCDPRDPKRGDYHGKWEDNYKKTLPGSAKRM